MMYDLIFQNNTMKNHTKTKDQIFLTLTAYKKILQTNFLLPGSGIA